MKASWLWGRVGTVGEPVFPKDKIHHLSVRASLPLKNGVAVERTFHLEINPTGIAKISWQEERRYPLGDGGDIALSLTPVAEGIRLGSDRWKINGSDVLQWGEAVSLLAEGQRDGLYQRRHHNLVLALSPSVSDVGENCVRAVSISPSYPKDIALQATLRITWDGDEIYDIETIVRGRVQSRRGKTSPEDLSSLSFSVADEVPEVGRLQDRLTLACEGDSWKVASALIFGEGPDGIRWVGTRNGHGWEIQHLWKGTRGKWLKVHQGLTRLEEGERRLVSFGDIRESTEYFCEATSTAIHFSPLRLPHLPKGYSWMTESERFLLPPGLLTDSVDLHSGRTALSLPFDAAEVMRHCTLDRTRLLADTPPDEVLYPTPASLEQIVAVAKKGVDASEAERTLKLQFTGSQSPLLLELTATYRPQEKFPWQFGRITDHLSEIKTEWNGEERPSLISYISRRGTKRVPVLRPMAPGTVSFQTALMGGKAGFFCLLNATGTTARELALREAKARDGFLHLLHAQATGLHLGVTRRFVGSLDWSVDQI
ncbi:MAG: hypothetical protein HY073_00025, partial [Deltaproteobacteria bacterium]|nr:hypothetical protein [Deltaproteobacteria bacterium]